MQAVVAGAGRHAPQRPTMETMAADKARQEREYARAEAERQKAIDAEAEVNRLITAAVDKALVRAWMETQPARKVYNARPKWIIVSEKTADAIFAVLREKGF